MAAVINIYPAFLLGEGDGTFDMNGDTFNLALMGAAHSYNSAHDRWSNVSANEIANGNGYTTGGLAITPSYTRNASVVTFDLTDAIWTASGAGITAYHAVLRKVGTANGIVDALVATIILNDSGGAQAVSATAGNEFRVLWNASGVYTKTLV